MVTDILVSIGGYLSQNANDWISLARTFDYNPVLITVIAVACMLLAVSFYTVAWLLKKSGTTKGFFSKEHKRLGIWFILLLFLVGTTFLTHILLLIYPLYWVYAGILLVTSIVASLTAYLYKLYFIPLSLIPSVREIVELQEENRRLKDKERLLKGTLSIWSNSTGIRIKHLTEDLEHLRHSDGESIPRTEEQKNIEKLTLEALTNINKELSELI